jgi:tRNA modification GTPase
VDTIFALASAQGRAGVAVVRISGPMSWEAVRRLCGDVPLPRLASLRKVLRGGDVLDEGLVLTFAEGASFTGEQSAELHLHGSVAAVRAVLLALSESPGLRMAFPGEFTRRAVENGRMDLSQAEGLADLIDAETEAQRRQAQQLLAGALGKRAADWRQTLVEAAALIEAHIDFADEDIPERVLAGIGDRLGKLSRDFGEEVDRYAVSERIRDGFEVAIVGRPNVGKSTLLNALAGREVAITSEFAGTTRDVIEVRMDLGGLPVTMLDTAGVRETVDPVEAIGVDRTRQRASASDLRVFLMEPGDVPTVPEQAGDIFVAAKADRHLARTGGLAVSGTTGQGLGDLVEAISASLQRRAARPATITRERHRLALVRASGALAETQSALVNAPDQPELAAHCLREAIRALDSLVGRVDVEHLLDEIFARFCIGK